MRTLYWYISAFLRKHGAVFIASLSIGLVLFWFFIPAIASNIEVRNRYYIGLIGNYSLTNLPPIIKNQLSVGLTRIDTDGSALPALSQRWTTEQDNTTFRFLLRDALFWQDGQPLTPNSIQYSFPDVETIYTPNDIVFKLPDSFAPFPTLVSEPIFRPASRSKFFFFSEPTIIGIGAYEISGYKDQGQRLSELRIDGEGKRYIYRFYLTEQDAVRAFKRGEVDILPDLSREYDINEWPSVEVVSEIDTSSYLAVFFNNADPLLSRNIRQGLSYGLTKKQDETRAIGPISPSSWAYLPGGKTYNYEFDRGAERLRDELPREKLEFTLTTTALFQDQAQRIKQEWETFGDQAVIACQNDSNVTEKELCQNLDISIWVRVQNFPDTSDFQLLLVGQQVPPDPDQYNLWHSEQPTNFTRYKNTRIDDLLERGRQTHNKNERVEIYQEFQQFFLEDPPAVFLEYLPNYTLHRKSVKLPEVFQPSIAPE